MKTLLANRDLLQRDLAGHLGWGSAQASKALSGKRKWQLEDLEAMAEFFDVSVALFFEQPEAVVRSRWSSLAPQALLPAS